MEKWEKLNLKIEILNLLGDSQKERKEYRIVHDKECTPILYLFTEGVGTPIARGTDVIDSRVSSVFAKNPSLGEWLIKSFLREDIF